MTSEAGVPPGWLEKTVDTVIHQLQVRPGGSASDIYVWSDGSVTGPKDPESRVAELHLVAQFTPGESPSRTAVRESLVLGLKSAPRGAESPVTPSRS